MKIKFGNKDTIIESLVNATKANSYPDLLYLAGGKTTKPGSKAKFRITLTLNGSRIKRWKETVEFTEAGGKPYGNLFDALLMKRDDLEGKELLVAFEVDTGAGYVELMPGSLQVIDNGPLHGAIFGLDAGNGVSGLFGAALMP